MPKAPALSHVPEVLAPAGDLASLDAALRSGADAVYFGLDDGFNARARAANFPREGLPATVAHVHKAGARAYLTLNTLIFEVELPEVEAIVRAAAAAGVDALIVQDPAVALIARAVCPAMEVHASTQMTVSSPDGAELCRALGMTRVVVPRELSVDEIRRFRAGTDLELEVFVHGALCMSWSGQCLTSEAWGGRSANRGQCAQACRLPYTLMVDGEARDLGDVQYLLSPRDLSGVAVAKQLAEIGVHGLKIEGRQKGPVYVAAATRAFRDAVDGLAQPDGPSTQRLADLSLAYSRGASLGFLGGTNHQTLVEGRFPEHRGIYLGRVTKVGRQEVVVTRESRAGDPVDLSSWHPAPGMGVVFDQGRPAEDEPGGPLFRVDVRGKTLTLGFGRPGPDLDHVKVQDRVFVTSDPALPGRLAAEVGRGEQRRVPVDLSVSGNAGAPLVVAARVRGERVHIVSGGPLGAAERGGLTADLVRDKLGALGDTRYRLRDLDTSRLAAGLHLPVSELKALRRELVLRLDAAVDAPRTLAPGPVLPPLKAERFRTLPPKLDSSGPLLVPLCRTEEQLDVALGLGFPEVELDAMEMVGLGRWVEKVRAAGRRVVIATVRVQKPGEEGFDSRIARLRPDGVLVRHVGALAAFARIPAESRPTLHGDFSLNVTNSLTAGVLAERGLTTLTASHDLDEVQLLALAAELPAGLLAVTIHHHISTFHTEHCVYAHTLSDGRDFKTCGRPCESHRIGLRDEKQKVHPVIVDVGCRNTVFNASAQSAPGLVKRLSGVARLRIELVWENREETERVLRAYQELAQGRITPRDVLARIGLHEQYGVSKGTMTVLERSAAPAAARPG
ncbi:MAG: U32 family peptidase [Myxococcales bacterium]|nr:U32 family peptidase [Myxococcales bacterium]